MKIPADLGDESRPQDRHSRGPEHAILKLLAHSYEDRVERLTTPGSGRIDNVKKLLTYYTLTRP